MAHTHMVVLQDPDGVSRPTYKDMCDLFCLFHDKTLSRDQTPTKFSHQFQFSLKDIAVNFIWLKPIREVFPDRVPSQFFMTDVILMLNLFLDSKLLLVAGESEMEMYPDQETKVELARQETTRLKRLLGGLRYLWRNGYPILKL